MLIFAGVVITLVLMVGGTFAVSAFIASSHDRDARGELARVAAAQASFYTDNDRYASLAVGPDVKSPNTELEKAKVGYKSNGANTVVRTSRSGWTAVTESKSGKVFVRTSYSNRTDEVEGTEGPAADALGPKTLSRTNLADYPDGAYSRPLVPGFGYHNNRYAGDGAYRNVLHATDTPPIGVDSYIRFTANKNALAARKYGFHIASNLETATPGNGTAAVTPGETYTISSYWRSSTHGAGHFRVRFANATAWLGGAMVGPDSSTSKANRWVQASITFKVPAGATQMSATLYSSDSLAPNDTIDATGLLVEKASKVGTYFDGSSYSSPTAEHSWTGAESRSTSRLYTRAVLNDKRAWVAKAMPTGLQLPVGITWGNVLTDIARVTA